MKLLAEWVEEEANAGCEQQTLSRYNFRYLS